MASSLEIKSKKDKFNLYDIKIDGKEEKRIKELKKQLAGIYDEINNITRT